MDSDNNIRLNDYISMIINSSGINYVVENYCSIRENYYETKQN